MRGEVGILGALGAFKKIAFAGNTRNQTGAAALVIAVIIIVVGFTALAVFLRGLSGAHSLAKAKPTGSGLFVQSTLAYYHVGINSHTLTPLHVIPCPSTVNAAGGGHRNSGLVMRWDYDAQCRCGALGDARIEPKSGDRRLWQLLSTLMSFRRPTRASAIASPAITRTNRKRRALKPFTLYVQSASGTRRFPFAIIGHGFNGLGARTQ